MLQSAPKILLVLAHICPPLPRLVVFILSVGVSGFFLALGQANAAAATDGTSGEGILVITSFNEVAGGVSGTQSRRAPLTTQLKIAPMVKNQPDFTHAIVVTTDSDGTAKINLEPGLYWIGPIDDTATRLAQPGAPVIMQPAQASVETNAETIVTVVQRSFAP